jgi:ABC-type multidrug transport system fused ATPase/permease subunit
MEERARDTIRYLSQYVRPHRNILLVSVALSVISTGLGLIQPVFAKVLIDKVFIEGRHELLYAVLVGVVSLLLMSFLVRVSNSYIYTRYSAQVLFQMRQDLFDHLQRAPLTLFTKKKIGDIYSRIAGDMADIQALVTDTIPGYLFNSVTCVITAGFLFWLNWRMALISVCFLPIALYVISQLRPRLLELGREVAENNADIAHFLFESLSGIGLIRAFGAERLEGEKLREKHEGMLRFLLRYQVLGALSGAVPTLYTVVNTIVVFGYGGYLVINESLSIGGLVAFTAYQARLFGPLHGLMEGFLAMQKSRVALGRVEEILDLDPAFPEEGDIVIESQAFLGGITLEGVSFAYEENEPVLRDLTIHIPEGKVTAIVGPSGVGKTTICHLIMRLFDPEAGRTVIDGKDLRELKMEWWRNQVALVSQDTFLFHSTIAENIRFSKPEATDGQIIEAARAACIHEFIASLPEGYQTVVGDRGLRLSGGQKQRLSIARAILIEPKILILDEAMAFLDTSAETRLKETIRSLMQGKTTLLVSHRASTIEGADWIIALGTDGLLYEGNPSGYPTQGSAEPYDEAIGK